MCTWYRSCLPGTSLVVGHSTWEALCGSYVFQTRQWEQRLPLNIEPGVELWSSAALSQQLFRSADEVTLLLGLSAEGHKVLQLILLLLSDIFNLSWFICQARVTGHPAHGVSLLGGNTDPLTESDLHLFLHITCLLEHLSFYLNMVPFELVWPFWFETALWQLPVKLVPHRAVIIPPRKQGLQGTRLPPLSPPIVQVL